MATTRLHKGVFIAEQDIPLSSGKPDCTCKRPSPNMRIHELDCARVRMDMADPPFACPPDVVLELPPPPSVNDTRKIDWKSRKRVEAWLKAADNIALLKRSQKQPKIPGRFEALITISETHTGIDLDNGIKAIIDYAKRLKLITDDSKKYLRKLTVEWGNAPYGVKVILRGVA